MLLNMASKSFHHVARSESSAAQATSTDCSVNNTCLGGGVNSTLVIVLGSCIPILIACVVLFFIHRHHVKRLKREEKNDKDFDMDFGVGDLPAPIPTKRDLNNSDLYHQNLADPTVAHSGFQPHPSGLPYLVPKANMSRESLHTISDPRDDPYAAIYSSAPPSPGGAATFSANSDKMSISGRSTKNLIPPSPQADSSNSSVFNPAVRPPPRVPSPLAFADQESSSHYHAQSNPAFDGSANMTPSEFPVQGRSAEDEDSQNLFGQDDKPPSSRQKNFILNRSQSDFADDPISDLGIPLSTHYPSPSRTDNYARNEPEIEPQIQPWYSNRDSSSEPRSQVSSSFEPSNERNDSQSTNNTSYQSPALADPIRKPGDVPTRTLEDEEDHAKRIQSVYREYYGIDSQYYDGSEDWESLPQRPAQDHQSKTTEPVPLPTNDGQWNHLQQAPRPLEWNGPSYHSEWKPPQQHNRQDWNAQAQPQYAVDEWHPANYGQDYYGGGQDQPAQQVYTEQPIPVAPNYIQSPPVRSYHSRPSTSYSVSSLPSRSRTPTRNIPLEPLTSLPSRDKLDDLASPISYAKPRRFMGASGTASPVPRSASPANVLSSSFLQLSELPVPHRLRRSGSFSSIDFAPMRKYGGSEVDVGDTASIRSLARTEQSLMAVSAGAGRIDRLPIDLIPLGKSGALSSLRPQNYGGNRYL